MCILSKSMYVLFFISSVGMIYATMLTSVLQEYCLSDTFNPECGTGQVLVMQQAHYGRMRLGRCVQMDRGALGCYSDELATFDKYCSGLKTCTVGIYNKEIIDRLTCLKELNPYLEASFKCMEVHSPRRASCSGPEVAPVTVKEGFLSNQMSSQSSCGSHNSPWILEAKPGQKIKVSLLDFNWDPDNTNHIGCKVKYGYILDVGTDDIMNICGGTTRERELYTSTGNRLQVVFESGDQRYLLKYKALGCPDYKAPEHAWTETVNSSVVVGCVSSQDTWKLTCVDGNWLGFVGICAPASTTGIIQIHHGHPDRGVESEANTLPPMNDNHVIAFGLGCLTVVICCVVVILGFYCTKRYEANYKMKSHSATLHQPTLLRTLPPNREGVTYKPTLSKAAVSSGNEDLPSYSMALAKDQRAPPVPHRTSSYRGDMSESMMSDYLAPQGGDDNSVKYYILENPADSGGKEEMYQSIHLFSSLERQPQAS